MILTLGILYTVLFVILTWQNFRFSIGLFVILLPTYLIRFQFGPFPTTLLEMTFGAIGLVWLIKFSRSDWSVLVNFFKIRRWFGAFFFLFLLASIISVFASDKIVPALGHWRAFFLEPMILFVILLGRGLGSQENRSRRITQSDLIWFLGLSTLSISILAIVQKLTGAFFPPSLWADDLFGRVTSFFTSPNAIGLFLVPVIFLAVPVIVEQYRLIVCHPRESGDPVPTVIDSRFHGNDKYSQRSLFAIIIISCSLLAIFFSFSQGAWVALAAGLAVFLFFINFKKIAVIFVLVGLIICLLMPSMRAAVLFQDKAGQNRLRLWNYSLEYLTKSPKNFVLGTGIRQFFKKIQKPEYNVKEMERLIYPHNIFLNFWTETGLAGMVAMVGLLGCVFYEALSVRRGNKLIGASLLAALSAIIIQGLVDVPYFKNDLAMEFWIVIVIIFIGWKEPVEIKKHP